MIGDTSGRDFKSIVSNNMIPKSPVTTYDFTNSHTRFGTNLAGIRDKKVQQNTDRAVMDYIAIPKNFMKLHKSVTLTADVMFVNVTLLLINMSHGIKFVTAKQIPLRTYKQSSKSLKWVMKMYSRSSMIVQTLLTDM